MAGPALVAVGRHDGELRQVGKRQRKRRQALGLVAVVIAKQYLHESRSPGVRSGRPVH